MSLQEKGGKLVVNSGGDLFDDPECCCADVCPTGDCSTCTDLTGVISGQVGCPVVNGTYTLVRSGCQWLGSNSSGAVLQIYCYFGFWVYQVTYLGSHRVTHQIEASPCPRTGLIPLAAWSDPCTYPSTLTIS